MDTPEQSAAPAAKPSTAARMAGKKRLIFTVLAVLLILGLAYYWWERGRASTDDAFVDGRIYSITPRVSGYLVEMLVDDNQAVDKDQLLLVLDPTDYQVALAEAKANLAEARSTLTALELGVPLELSQTEQRVRGARAELAALQKSLAAAQQQEQAAEQDHRRTQAASRLANLDLERALALRGKGAISQSSLDNAQTRQQSAQAQMRAAQAQAEAATQRRASLAADLDRAKANIALAATGQDQATIKTRQMEAQKARVELAQARLRQAELDLAYTRVTAPAKGRITRKKVEAGQMVAKGQPLMALVPLEAKELWVTANFKETQLARVRPGQPVDIEVDSFPGHQLTGKVDSIMAGTGSAFSLFPPENASGNYVKIVQRVPVKIVLDAPEDGQSPALRLGMSVVPVIHTGR